MKAKIYRPAKTAMSSGKAGTVNWILEYVPEDDHRFIDPLMGWTGSDDTVQQVKLKFTTREAAIKYAEDNQLDYIVHEPYNIKRTIRNYADNFTLPPANADTN